MQPASSGTSTTNAASSSLQYRIISYFSIWFAKFVFHHKMSHLLYLVWL